MINCLFSNYIRYQLIIHLDCPEVFKNFPRKTPNSMVTVSSSTIAGISSLFTWTVLKFSKTFHEKHQIPWFSRAQIMRTFCGATFVHISVVQHCQQRLMTQVFVAATGLTNLSKCAKVDHTLTKTSNGLPRKETYFYQQLQAAHFSFSTSSRARKSYVLNSMPFSDFFQAPYLT